MSEPAPLQSAVGQPGPDGKLVSPLDLSAFGFKFVYQLKQRGSRGNPVFLALYTGDIAGRPAPSGRGRDSVDVNAAHVPGLADDVAADVNNLLVPRGARVDGSEVQVGGRPALLVHDGFGRYVVVAQGDWRIQVSTDAPREVLSDEALIKLTAKAEVR